ncbi:MAG: hypothetical protein ACLUTM_03390 [Streptococcus constellatus]
MITKLDQVRNYFKEKAGASLKVAAKDLDLPYELVKQYVWRDCKKGLAIKDKEKGVIYLDEFEFPSVVARDVKDEIRLELAEILLDRVRGTFDAEILRGLTKEIRLLLGEMQ